MDNKLTFEATADKYTFKDDAGKVIKSYALEHFKKSDELMGPNLQKQLEEAKHARVYTDADSVKFIDDKSEKAFALLRADIEACIERNS